MRVFYELRRRAAQVILPVLSVCAATYFGYHVVQGDRGLIAYARLVNEIEALEVKLAEAEAESAVLERRVSLLEGPVVDPDILDERARAVLGFAHPDDVILYLPQAD